MSKAKRKPIFRQCLQPYSGSPKPIFLYSRRQKRPSAIEYAADLQVAYGSGWRNVTRSASAPKGMPASTQPAPSQKIPARAGGGPIFLLQTRVAFARECPRRRPHGVSKDAGRQFLELIETEGDAEAGVDKVLVHEALSSRRLNPLL